MDFFGGGVGEGTPTGVANGWVIMIILTVPFLLMVLLFSLCCCRYYYFDYCKPISTWRRKRNSQRMEEMGKNAFVVGDVRRQHSVVGIDEEQGESLSQRMRRLREGMEGECDGQYSPTVHLSPGYRSPSTISGRGSVIEHYPSMVPEVSHSTMASVNGMVTGSSYCPSVASTSYGPISQLGSVYAPDTRDLYRSVSLSGSVMTGSPYHPIANAGNHTFARYASYNNNPPSVPSLHRISYSSLDSIQPVSRSNSRNAMPAPKSTFSPSKRQAPSRRTSLLSMQRLPSNGRENLQTVPERSASMDESIAESSEPMEGVVEESSNTHELTTSASQSALSIDKASVL